MSDSAPTRADQQADEPRRPHDVLDLAQHEEGGDKGSGEPPPKPPGKTVFVVAGLVLLAGLGWGGYEHWRTYSDSKGTASETQDQPVDVRTAEAKKQDAPLDLTLPGQTDAFDTASLYARATGYVTERRVDIGARVKKGDLLVHITAPDLDQQLAQANAQIGQVQASLTQAKAQVDQAEANVNLAKVTFARTNQLTQQGYETQQNRDNQQANVQSQQANVEAAKAGVGVAEANVRAQQATIDRLKALTAFEDVRAPFDGVITSRGVDTGDLLSADQSTGSPLFTIARDAIIRVTVRVPQSDAVGVREGLEAQVHVAQMPDRVFTGRVQRSSEALLYSSRTLTVEVDVPNTDGALRSGLYVSVTLKVPRERPDVNVPAEALMFNQKGMQVATVTDDKIKLHSIDIFRDHGTSVDVRIGLDGGERVVLSPPATTTDGMKVKEHRQEDEKKPDDKEQQKPPADVDKQANAAPPDNSKQ